MITVIAILGFRCALRTEDWMAGPTQSLVQHGFDPLGRCVKRWYAEADGSAPGAATYFAYDGWNLVQEGYSPWSASRFYIHGSRVDEIVQSYNAGTGLLAYHYYDASGHCTMLTDTSGGILEQYAYDAFGYPHFYNSTAQPLNSSTFGNRFLFTGREWLSELRLYDFRNRLYNPELGRFLQPDPTHFAAGDYNLYRYCHNDPINKSDPFGLKPGDPFDFPDQAAHDAHNFLNPLSIKHNVEYGSIIYQKNGHFYTSEGFTNNAGAHIKLGGPDDKGRIPGDAKRVGDYHTHGDYSKAVLNQRLSRPGHPVFSPQRAPKSEDGYDSDHFSSKTDKPRAESIAKRLPDYRTFLGAPSREFKEYDAINKKEKQ